MLFWPSTFFLHVQETSMALNRLKQLMPNVVAETLLLSSDSPHFEQPRCFSILPTPSLDISTGHQSPKNTRLGLSYPNLRRWKCHAITEVAARSLARGTTRRTRPTAPSTREPPSSTTPTRAGPAATRSAPTLLSFSTHLVRIDL